MGGLVAASLVTGAVLCWWLWGTLVRPKVENPLLRLRRWWFWGILAVGTLWLWTSMRGAAAELPPALWWIALGTAFGPAAVFAFVYVRIDSSAIYHRLIRDAALIGEPLGSELGSE